MSGPTNSNDLLRSFVERIENLEEDRRSISDDIKDVFSEAKGNGYDIKILKSVIRIRAMDRAEWEENDAVLTTYLAALGIIPAEGVAA